MLSIAYLEVTGSYGSYLRKCLPDTQVRSTMVCLLIVLLSKIGVSLKKKKISSYYCPQLNHINTFTFLYDCPSQTSAIREPWTSRCSSWFYKRQKEPEIKLPTSAGSWKKQESSRKTSISALLTMPKPLTVWITINCGKF